MEKNFTKDLIMIGANNLHELKYFKKLLMKRIIKDILKLGVNDENFSKISIDSKVGGPS